MKRFVSNVMVGVAVGCIVLVLVSCGESKNPKEVLYDAATAGDLIKVKALIAAGTDADPYRNGCPAMVAAAKRGHTEVVKALLAAGASASVNANDAPNISSPKNGRTALMYASQDGNIEMVKVLLAAKANVEARYLIGPTDPRLESGAAWLLRHGFKPRPYYEQGRTALMLASQNGHVEVVKALLAAGAYVNAKDSSRDGAREARLEGSGSTRAITYQETALEYATQYGHAEVVELLKQAGAKQVPDGEKMGAVNSDTGEEKQGSHPKATPSITTTISSPSPTWYAQYGPNGTADVVLIGDTYVASRHEGAGCNNGFADRWLRATRRAEDLVWLGKEDWRLPTLAELKLICENKDKLVSYQDGEYGYDYWTSERVTEDWSLIGFSSQQECARCVNFTYCKEGITRVWDPRDNLGSALTDVIEFMRVVRSAEDSRTWYDSNGNLRHGSNASFFRQ